MDEFDWTALNRRRGELVDREIAGTITSAEAAELAALQAVADAHLEETTPRPTRRLEEAERAVAKLGREVQGRLIETPESVIGAYSREREQ